MSTPNASTKSLSSQSPDAQNATNGKPVNGSGSGPAPTEPEGGYPEQKHAGAVGYGPEYGRMHQATTGEKLEGLKEQIVGKLSHNPEKAEHGRELRTGELKRKQQQENDSTDPFKTAGDDKPGQPAANGNSSDDVAGNTSPTPVTDEKGGPGAAHPTDAGARQQAATTAPEGTTEARKQAQGGNTDRQRMFDEGSGPA